jgi:hypothetical protein
LEERAARRQRADFAKNRLASTLTLAIMEIPSNSNSLRLNILPIELQPTD